MRALLSSDWAVDLLERRDVPASAPEAGDGLQIQAVAYRLQRRGGRRRGAAADLH